jgi:hypothetical protein
MYVTRRNVPDVELLDAVFASPDTSETFARLVDAVPPGSYQVASAVKGRRALLVRSPSGRTPDAVAGCGSPRRSTAMETTFSKRRSRAAA